MNAEEAKKLMNGSMSHKGVWFKTRLNWFCGRLNKSIENAAEHGKQYTTLQLHSRATAKQYFPVMAHFYEDLGFYVAFSYRNNTFEVYWDLTNISDWKIKDLTCNSCYDHHIKLEEPLNESNSAPSGNRENKGTIKRSKGKKWYCTNTK